MTHEDEPRDPAGTEEEPRLEGTLVILMLFLMALVAMWALMYSFMLEM
jgi:hypothetical protein